MPKFLNYEVTRHKSTLNCKNLLLIRQRHILNESNTLVCKFLKVVYAIELKKQKMRSNL